MDWQLWIGSGGILGVIIVIATMAHYKFTGIDEKVGKAQDTADKAHLEIKDHKLHVSETYARDTSMQQSLARVHERIDEASRELKGEISVISTDIKTILGKMK